MVQAAFVREVIWGITVGIGWYWRWFVWYGNVWTGIVCTARYGRFSSQLRARKGLKFALWMPTSPLACPGFPDRDSSRSEGGGAAPWTPEGHGWLLLEENVWSGCADAIPRQLLSLHRAQHGGRHLVQGKVSSSSLPSLSDALRWFWLWWWWRWWGWW